MARYITSSHHSAELLYLKARKAGLAGQVEDWESPGSPARFRILPVLGADLMTYWRTKRAHLSMWMQHVDACIG